MNSEDRFNRIEDRVVNLETQVADVKIGMAQLHGDLKMTAQEMRHVADNVKEIKTDTSEMVSIYKAQPRIQASTKFWMYVIGWFMATATTISSVLALFFKLP